MNYFRIFISKIFRKQSISPLIFIEPAHQSEFRENFHILFSEKKNKIHFKTWYLAVVLKSICSVSLSLLSGNVETFTFWAPGLKDMFTLACKVVFSKILSNFTWFPDGMQFFQMTVTTIKEVAAGLWAIHLSQICSKNPMAKHFWEDLLMQIYLTAHICQQGSIATSGAFAQHIDK